MNIGDLQVERDIVPIFDDYLNSKSKEALLAFFLNIPNTLDEIIERQEIIRSFVDQSHFSSMASYRRDIEEAYSFTLNIVAKDGMMLRKTIPSMRFHLNFDKKYRSRLISRAIQFGFILDRIYHNYFRELRSNKFPAAYAEAINRMLRFFEGFKEFRSIENFRSGNAGEKQYYLLLRQLYLKSLSGEAEVFWNDFFTFDAYVSIANSIRKRKFVMPNFLENGMEIRNLYHPLIKDPIKSSISTHSSVVLLTGPNMSGKSTFLKSVSICVYLAHLGLAVPADHCAIPYYEEFHVRLNKTDDLEGGLSHFMSELRDLKQILSDVNTKRSVFVALDEMFSGTNLDDAQALFKVTIAGLARMKSGQFFISTHFSEMKDLIAAQDPAVACYYLDASIENGLPVFSYQLKPGWSDARFGQILFEREGLREMLE